MEEKGQGGEKQPKLRIVDENEPITRLDNKPTPNQPRERKKQIRPSKEDIAIKKSLEEQEFEPSSTETTAEIETLTPPPNPLRIPPLVFVLFGGAFFVLLGFGIFMAMGGRNRDGRFALQEKARENIETSQQEIRVAQNIVRSLEEAIQKYTSATTIEEKLLFARQPKRVEPLMRKYYSTHEMKPLSGSELISQFAFPLKTRSFSVLTVSFDDGTENIYLAEINNDLSITIDWESDVCYQPVNIAEYILNKPTDPVTLRVYARPDNFYVYEFHDGEKYQCLKLTFRDSDDVLYGYIDRENKASQKIFNSFSQTYNKKRSNYEPLLINARFLENSTIQNGVLIEDILATRWAYIDKFENEEQP